MFAFSQKAGAQLGFCNGNSGDPIFTETFGNAPNAAIQYVNLASLPLGGTTNYNFRSGPLGEGDYHITNRSNAWINPYDWHQISDHTGDTNGRMLVANASTSPGEFFNIQVGGLCETTTYEFSSWMLNLSLPVGVCGPSVILPNVRFEIWDGTNTILLASGETGDIPATSSPEWDAYALVFQTSSGQTDVILKMINNSSGGCGNDLAIDDIVFKTCSDLITVEDNTSNNSATLCSSQAPFISTLTAIPDFTVYNSHFYQWQESTDAGITWSDITGATNQTLPISVLSTSYYRAKIAEVAVNLTNPQCVSFSNEFQVIINQLPTAPSLACWETATINNSTCSWDISGNQPIQPIIECWEIATFNTTTCSWIITGSQPIQPTINCWETATFNSSTCSWEVTGNQPIQPTLGCWETIVFNNTTCTWDISGIQPVQPVIECWETTTFNSSSCSWEVTGSQPIQPTLECWETTVFNNTTCTWDISGIQPVQPVIECWETTTFNSSTCVWEVTGTQAVQPTLECWETATFNNSTCSWDISGMQPGNVTEENLNLCEDNTLILQSQSNILNPSFVWSTGAVTEDIIIDTSGTYTVEIIGAVCSFETKIFNVTLLEKPLIENVISDGNDIIITTVNNGDFEYSIDGTNFQMNNIFYNIQGGLYSIYIKQRNCSDIITTQYLHFYIPKYFTPNNDGINDTFSLSGIEFYNSSEVSIFNRYGKLLKFARNTVFNWDGSFKGEILPSDDYWYIIIIEDQKFSGHFTLKR